MTFQHFFKYLVTPADPTTLQMRGREEKYSERERKKSYLFYPSEMAYEITEEPFWEGGNGKKTFLAKSN